MSKLYASMGLVPYVVLSYLWDLVEKIQEMKSYAEVYSLNPPGLWGIDPTVLGHFLVGD